MHTILIVDKQGNIKHSKVTTIGDDLYKKAGLKNKGSFDVQTTWDVELKIKYSISLYAKTDGRAGNENKYELPPPIDKTLYFGNLILVNNNGDLSLEQWEEIYNKLHGGFDDLDESESEEEDDEEGEYVKEGYKKDGFIVDDNSDDSESDEEESEESDEFYLTDELCEEEYV